MGRPSGSLLALVLLPPCACAAPRGAPALAREVAPYSARADDAWTALFARAEGWTGGDGVYAIPLDGDERPGAGARARTWITFGDTFHGRVAPDGRRAEGTVMVNNSAALLAGARPDPAAIAFRFGADESGAPAALVEPGAGREGFLWLQDGLVHAGALHQFALRVVPNEAFGRIVGVDLVTWPLEDGAPGARYEVRATPLFREPASFGRAVLACTEAAGAPRPDGFVYVYGLAERPLAKDLLVARVRPDDLSRFDAYRFWDGAEWSADRARAAPVASRLSSEFSVSALADGRVLIVDQQDDLLGPAVTARVGASPVGPFADPVPIYRIPEQAADDDGRFAYGAKAHPHLSPPGELLISYHVNINDFAAHFRDAGIYRPRFVRLLLR